MKLLGLLSLILFAACESGTQPALVGQPLELFKARRQLQIDGTGAGLIPAFGRFAIGSSEIWQDEYGNAIAARELPDLIDAWQNANDFGPHEWELGIEIEPDSEWWPWDYQLGEFVAPDEWLGLYRGDSPLR